MEKLINGELILTINIIIGFIFGEIITHYKLSDKIFSRIMPHMRIPRTSALAICASLGSSRAGAVILSGALNANEITSECAIWSALMLSFPSYLRRWPRLLITSASLAGISGIIYAFSVLFVSACKFITSYILLKRVTKNYDIHEISQMTENENKSHKSTIKTRLLMLAKTLPLAWIFYAAAYSLVPIINDYMSKFFGGAILPLAGWTVAGSAIVRVNAALAMTGGYLASGELNIIESSFALILGSGIASVTRILRMNAGYYFGMFNASTARKMLTMNMLITLIYSLIIIIIAYIILCLH